MDQKEQKMRHKINMLAIVAMARFIPPSHCDLLIHQEVDISLMEKTVVLKTPNPIPRFKIHGYYKPPKVKKFRK